MQTVQTVGEGLSGALSAVSVLKGLSEIKEGFNELKTLRTEFKEKYKDVAITSIPAKELMSNAKSIGAGLLKMAAGTLRTSAATVAIVSLAGVSTSALAAASMIATPVVVGLGVYKSCVFMNQAATSYQASSSFEVAGRLLAGKGPQIDPDTIGGKLRTALLVVTTGKNIDELKAMATEIKTKYGDKADEYVNLERKCNNRQMMADIVRSGTVITATFAFGGLATLIPLTAPFLGPVAFFVPVVVGGAIAVTGFKLASYPESAAKDVRAEISMNFPEPKDPMPNGHVEVLA